MSEQLSPFTHWAQVLSGLAQLASQEKPDELRLQDTSLSHASLQLALEPQPASTTPSAATHAIHQLFTWSLPCSGPLRPRRRTWTFPSRPIDGDALHPHLRPPGATPRREANATHCCGRRKSDAPRPSSAATFDDVGVPHAEARAPRLAAAQVSLLGHADLEHARGRVPHARRQLHAQASRGARGPISPEPARWPRPGRRGEPRHSRTSRTARRPEHASTRVDATGGHRRVSPRSSARRSAQSVAICTARLLQRPASEGSTGA